MFAVQGQATDIAIQAEEILKLKKLLNELLAGHTGQPLSIIGMYTVFYSYHRISKGTRYSTAVLLLEVPPSVTCRAVAFG